MAQIDLLKSLLDGTAPKNVRMLAARGLAPFPPKEMIEILVRLLKDKDQDIIAHAAQTLRGWAEDEVIAQLQARDCSPFVVEYFASASTSQPVLEAIILNPATPAKTIEALALTVSANLLEAILYSRVRIIESPDILRNVKLNPCMTPEVRRLVQEIEAEFFSRKKTEYAVEEPSANLSSQMQPPELKAEVQIEDLPLEGLPVDSEAREAALVERLSGMSVREKIRHALFGNREVRTMLIRDPNKEVARSVLQSPKLTESEVEAISAMRGVAEDILREIGNHKEWTRNYGVVQNLVKNPKTPALISQRMLFRLHSKDLMLLTRDRGIPDAVKRSAQRTLSQRTSTR